MHTLSAMAIHGMVELDVTQVETVAGGLMQCSWNSKATNWGEVGAWTLGGAVAGAGGGGLGAVLGAVGGGGADYLGQHLECYWY